MKITIEISKNKIIGSAALAGVSDDGINSLTENMPEAVEIPRKTLEEIAGENIKYIDIFLGLLASALVADKTAEQIKRDLANQETHTN